MRTFSVISDTTFDLILRKIESGYAFAEVVSLWQRGDFIASAKREINVG
ncbi:MAG: hypothetical protein RML35_06630 [Chloroherpetonaceae bacterium]|nr:hypothetical protein [Chloroherpetonaceae bacterium]